MLGRHIGYSCARKLGALPPVKFDRRSDARLSKMARIAKTGHGARRPACSHLAQRRQIHVVVMVVRHQKQVHAGQRIQTLSGSPRSARACNFDRATTVGPDRIGEDADAANLQ